MANETDELTVATTADTSQFQASLASLGKQSDSFASAITRVFKQAVVGGKDFGSVLSSLALQIAGMALDKALQPLTSLIGSGLSSLFSAFGLAKGGVVSGGQIQKFATGGVVSSPTLFPLAHGIGLMGEAGPLPASDANGFSPDGTTIAVAHATTPFVSVYPWSAGFGTKYSNPATPPAASGNGVAFSPSGAAIAVAHGTTPFVSAYPWSAGFGTKYGNPATLPAGNGNGVGFSPDGTSIAITHATTPFMSAYPWSAGFGTRYSDPATLPAGAGHSVAFI